jgi:hypothetical protein
MFVRFCWIARSIQERIPKTALVAQRSTALLLEAVQKFAACYSTIQISLSEKHGISRDALRFIALLVVEMHRPVGFFWSMTILRRSLL